ncbi:serine hydrolase domain-containing protein [Lysobacter sp. A289]
MTESVHHSRWWAMALSAVALLATATLPAATATGDSPPSAMDEARPVADPAPRLDRVFDAVMDRYQLPGLAVGVIEDGQVVYVRTAGELAEGSGQPVTPDTLFKIASNTKAMTAAVLARLVDAGKLRWDDPVVKHLPQFRMHDPWVTEHMQVRDLLVHNSGLPEGGGDLMLWPQPNLFDRDDIINGLAHIKPAYGFRSGYAYDNLLYVVAGEVAAAVGGASYEEMVRREVFQPLGLDRCKVGEIDRAAVGNIAQPHRREDGRNIPAAVDDEIIPAITSAAAGGIRCSVGDMLDWARNWLVPTEQQLQWLSPEQREAMWAARTPMPISQRSRDWNNTHAYAYAFGFRLADVDGAWTVSHTGTLSGMYSVMTLLPDLDSGFVVLMNGNAGEARTVINEVLLKHFTAPQENPTVADYAARIANQPASAGDSVMPDTSARVPATAATLSNHLGRYTDPWFGEVAVCKGDGDVRFTAVKSPRMRGQVMEVGERLLVDWDGPGLDEAWLDFADAGASPALSMAKVDPNADFSSDYEDLAFERTGDCD